METFRSRMFIICLTICGTITMVSGMALAKKDVCYEVKVTNMTRGQVFTPVLVATHTGAFQLFKVGEPVIEQLAQLAEGGNVVPLAEYLETMPDKIGSVAVSEGGPFGAGESVVVQVPAYKGFNRISLASMLALTNDGFISLNGVLSRQRHFVSPAYDAGSEANDELAAHVPGTGGEGYSPDNGEGFAHIHAGIQGIGDLPEPWNLDWRNPAAKITSKLVRCDLGN